MSAIVLKKSNLQQKIWNKAHNSRVPFYRYSNQLSAKHTTHQMAFSKTSGALCHIAFEYRIVYNDRTVIIILPKEHRTPTQVINPSIERW